MKKFEEQAKKLDREDRLSDFRSRFYDAGEKMIYLDGNSLGKLPLTTIATSENLIRREWGERLIRSWNEHWMDLPDRLAGKLARIIGADEDEVFVGDTTSINLYKLVSAVLETSGARKTVLTDALNFPSDLYVLQGLMKNHQLQTMASKDDVFPDLEALETQLNSNVALLTLSHVAYKSAYLYPMDHINALARENDIPVIWDLSHAAGAVPVDLKKNGADMAVGCTYKYLNGGPGAPAFLYVRKSLQNKLNNPIWAWFSHREPFAFDPRYEAASTIQRFATSTPTVLSLAAVEPGLDLILEAGMEAIREKSIRQTCFLLDMVTDILLPFGFKIASPTDFMLRGSHISVRHPEGYRINRAMIEPGHEHVRIIPDFRPPDNIRLGIAPLYVSFMELYRSVERIAEIMHKKEYERFGDQRLTVP